MARRSSNAQRAMDRPTTVRYVGTADTKILSADDLAAVGIKTKSTYEWNSSNDHALPVADIDGSTLTYLRSQPDFRVI